MTGKVILWLCVIWVPLVLYFFLANETKFKKNIVIGTTLPFEARTDPDVQARLGKFKRQLGAVCLILTALALMGLFLPLPMGESLTAMLVWTDLAIVAPWWCMSDATGICGPSRPAGAGGRPPPPRR